MNSVEALVELIVEAKSLNRNDSRLSFLRNEIEKDLEMLEIIKKHKLLNYVLKNEKCANMYHLSKEECDLLRELGNEWNINKSNKFNQCNKIID